MSVALQSPFTGTKRLFDDAESEAQQQGEATKRVRCIGSPAGRCRPAAHVPQNSPQHNLPPSTVAAVKALFPGMDSQVVETVLAECGNDIDAAIRRLNQLKLNTEHSSAATQQPTDAPADTAAVSDSPQAQVDATADAAGAAAAAAAAGPQTAEEWVDALVQEMATARDFGDARSRAGKLLQAFEQFVNARSRNIDTPSAAHARLDEVTRENHILKRAVQIQNAKLQEASAARDEEVAGLKQLVAQYQERLRQMELNNYSLALHLQKATEGDRSQTANRPPDVF